MKPGDYYLDNYYEPETVVIHIIENLKVYYDGDSFKGNVIYTSDPDRIGMSTVMTGYSDDPELIPVAMIYIDNKLMIIKL